MLTTNVAVITKTNVAQYGATAAENSYEFRVKYIPLSQSSPPCDKQRAIFPLDTVVSNSILQPPEVIITSFPDFAAGES
jgi:hypothetical protein